MERSTYQQIQAIMAEILTAPEGERAALAQRLCRGDELLFAKVQQMLAFTGDEQGAFSDEKLDERRQGLDMATAGDGSGPGGDDDEAWRPDSIGDYGIERIIGRGGSGVVFLARQKQPHRLVAIKLLSPAASTRTTAQRLVREAEILGKLQHPGIAQIFEAGSLDGGFGDQPYIVMEWVDGSTLTEYAATLRQSERVALIIRTAEAVEHAHERGVIHRDLKPDNILVDASGQPKVLDFGIARLTGSDTRGLTIDGQLMGTVAYMAPEQASRGARPVGHQADVFSLGAIAFEILTGRSPRRVQGLSITDVLRELTESDAPSARSIKRTIDKDLDTVLARALEIRPRDRYPTLAAFRLDLERVEQHRPVAARPVGVVGRALKFVRRNRTLSIGSAATFLALTGGLVATGMQARRAEQAEDLALVKRYAAEMMFATSLAMDPVTRGRSSDIVERWRAGAPLAAPVVSAGQVRWEWHLLNSLERSGTLEIATRTAPTCLDWHPDGTCVAITIDSGIAIHDARNGRELAFLDSALLTEPFAAYNLAWDSSGERIAAVGSGGLAVWTPPPGGGESTAEDVIHMPFAFAPGVLWVRDDKALVVCHERFMVFDAQSGERLVDSEGLYYGMRAFFEREGQVLVVPSSGSFEFFSLDSGARTKLALPEVKYPTAARFAPDGETLAVVGREGRLRLIDWAAKNQRLVVGAHLDAAFDVAWHPSGERVATAGEDGTVRVIDARTGRLTDSFNGHRTQVRRVAWSPDGARLATAAINGEALIWNAAEAPAIRTLKAPGLIPFTEYAELIWSRARDSLVATSDGRSAEWSLSSGLATADRASGGFERQSPDGQWTAWPSGESTLTLRANTADAGTRSINLGQDPWLFLRWAPDSSCVFAANIDGIFQVPVTATGQLSARRLADMPAQTFGLAVGARGKRLAVTTTNDAIVVLDASIPESARRISLPHLAGAECTDLSPGGAYVAVGCSDGDVRVYRWEDGSQTASWSGHVAGINAIAWHPSGDRVATGSDDRTVKVFDAASGDLMASFPSEEHVAAVCWFRNGQALAALDKSGIVTVWDASRSMFNEDGPTTR